MILKKKIGYGLGIVKNYRVRSVIGYPSGTGSDANNWNTGILEYCSSDANKAAM